MLYRIKPASINKVVGYMASISMVKGYQYDSADSIYNLKVRGPLDFEPNFNSIQLQKRSRPMDIIESVPVRRSGLILSNKLYDIVKGYRIPNSTQVFDASAIYNDKIFSYKFFYIWNSEEHRYIKWDQSRFKKCEFGVLSGEEFSVPINQYVADIENGKSIHPVEPTKLVFDMSELDTDILRLSISKRGYYISERLKRAIEESDCEGIELTPITELGFDVVFE